MLAPYLTLENHREVLARARFRRKREIELLVAELAPARDVPALIEPLAARAGARVPGSDWAAVAESSAGWVRQLAAGDGPTQAPSAPDDWHAELVDGLGAAAAADSAPARQEVEPHTPTATVAAHDAAEASPTNAVTPSLDEARTDASGEGRVVSARYEVQFTADQAYVDLLEQARALLWPNYRMEIWRNCSGSRSRRWWKSWCFVSTALARGPRWSSSALVRLPTPALTAARRSRLPLRRM